MSGMTRSIPNISSSGNIRPQSMTTMSSPYSNTYMFLPISPTPPSGMIRSGWFGVWHRGWSRFVVRRGSELVRSGAGSSGRRGHRSGAVGATSRLPAAVGDRWRQRRVPRAAREPRAGSRGGAADVLEALALDLGVAQSAAAGWYIAKRERVARAASPDRPGAVVPWAWRSASPGMNQPSECRPRVTTRAGSRTSSWRSQVRAQAAISSGSGSRLSGGRHLTTFVMKTSSRRQPTDPRSFVRSVAGPPDERPAVPVLVEARALADEDDLGVGTALARDGAASASRRAGSGCRPGPPPRSPRAPPGARPRSRPGPDRRSAPRGTALAPRAGGGPDPAALDEHLGDLDRVRRGALAEVVADDPEGEPAVVRDRRVLADAPDEDLVAARRPRSPADRSRSTGSSWTTTPGDRGEQLARPVRA